MKRWGKLSFRLVKKSKKGKQIHFMAVKKLSTKRSGFVIYSCFKEGAFTAVKGNAKF